jgi:hypothetical protein
VIIMVAEPWRPAVVRVAIHSGRLRSEAVSASKMHCSCGFCAPHCSETLLLHA